MDHTQGKTGEHHPDAGDPTVQFKKSQPSLSDSRAFDGGRYAPGTLLAGRYRVVARLGKGGMGEVYRADDLKLGVSVALKFLPRSFADDQAWLRRFHNEVRVAREVAHPNVCRTYDIGEADGEHFISMEYVDGEDLAILLRRIGRVPQDKAIQIAREICVGLAAAHDKGVLHRDLKPANIMLDGRGTVRITDFGIAALAEEMTEKDLGAGTPAYMAPEQLAHETVTVRSDVYSLGLILYELFTGREAYEADTLADLKRVRTSSSPSRPSSIVEDLDPVVERLIMRCLEPNPMDRPPSVIAVAAALPGGDPLAMALAAGETPSPEMVAQAGRSGALPPAVAVSCLAGFCLAVIVAVIARDRMSTLSSAPVGKPAAVLADRAREIVEAVGYTDEPGSRAIWFGHDWGFRRHLEKSKTSIDVPKLVETGSPPLMKFHYRTSPEEMVPEDPDGIVEWSDPSFATSGMTRVVLDTSGRLVEFQAIAPRWAGGEPAGDESGGAGLPTPPPDLDQIWSTLFAAAELQMDGLATAEPLCTPDVPSDQLLAWSAHWPDAPDFPIQVEAALYRGVPVSFHLCPQWDKPPGSNTGFESPAQRVVFVILSWVIGLLIVSTVVLALRNLRAGRVDRRGAWRLAMYVVIISLGVWLFSANHALDPSELGLFFQAILTSMGMGALTWLLYLAIEPYARRYWPRAIISWTRLLAGRFRDPMVGRDILFGCVAGAIIPLGRMLVAAAPTLAGQPAGPPPIETNLTTLLGGRRVIGELFNAQSGIFGFLMAFVFLLLLRILLRRSWLAIAVFCLILMTIFTNGFTAHPVEDIGNWVSAVGVTTLVTVTMVRFGLLSLLVMSITASLLVGFPLTFEIDTWYAPIGLVGGLFALALAGYGFWIALAGQPLFKEEAA